MPDRIILPNDTTSTLLHSQPTNADHPSRASQASSAKVYNNLLTVSAARSAYSSYFLNQLLAICGGCNAADAVEILAVSFILPSATDDLNLSSPEKGWLAGMIFAGMMLGGWIWGSLSDKFGRRPCLMWCLIINALGGAASAIAPGFGSVLMSRFVSGIGVGGSVPVVFTYFSEFLCTRDRGHYMVSIACCWMIGSLFTAGLAWIIIPLKFAWDLHFITFTSWRLFAALATLPSICCALALIGAPESPRWLLARGRKDEAKEVLIRIYSINWCQDMKLTDFESPTSEDVAASYGCTTWFGTCIRLTMPKRVRDYLTSTRTRTNRYSSSADVEQGRLVPAGSSPDAIGSSATLHQGSHGIKYSKIDVSGESLDPITTMASPGSSPSSSLTSYDLATGADGSLARSSSSTSLENGDVDDLYSSLFDESERWKIFLKELDTLDVISFTLEDDYEPIQIQSPYTAHDSQRMLDGSSSSSSTIRSDDLSDASLSSRCSALLVEIISSLRVVWFKTISLFGHEYLWTSLKLFATWFFLAFGYYGLTMWMPTYFASRGSSDDKDQDASNMNIYLTSVIGSLSALPSNILSLFTVRYYGRIKTLVASLFLSGICVLLVPALNSSTAAVVMLCIFTGVNTMSWNALNITTTECYHTEIRATAFGFFAACGRVGAVLGNVMFGDLMSDSAVVPILIAGAALVVASVAGWKLPETKSRNLG